MNDTNGYETEVIPEVVSITDGGAGIIKGKSVTITDGGAFIISGESVEITDGGAVFIVGETVRIHQGGGLTIIANQAELTEGSTAVFLVAKNASGQAKIGIDINAAVVFGLIVGAMLVAFKLLVGRRV